MIHLASPPHFRLSSASSPSFFDSISFTKKLITSFSATPPKTFCYTSSVNVYGNPPSGRLTVNSACLSDTPYASLKTATEYLLACAPFPVYILRLSNVFGPSSPQAITSSSLLINQLVIQALRSNSLLLRSNPTLERDFVCINAVIDLLLDLSLDTLTNASLGKAVFNITSSTNRSIFEVATHIATISEALTGKPCSIHTLSSPERTPSYSYTSSFPQRLSCSNQQFIQTIHDLFSLFPPV